MASQKISDLSELIAPEGGDMLVVVDDPAGTPETKKMTVTRLLTLMYPVGSLYFNGSAATSPATLLGFGTWARFGEGRVIVSQQAADADFDTAGDTGGAKTHTLTVAEMPAHTHNQGIRNTSTAGTAGVQGGSTANNATIANGVPTTGGGGAHNNMPPFIVGYVWIRTA